MSNTTTELLPFSMWGGYSYAVGDAEYFASVKDAAAEYVNRMTWGRDSVTGLGTPCWGEVGEDHYVITAFDRGWTLTEVIAIAEAE